MDILLKVLLEILKTRQSSETIKARPSFWKYQSTPFPLETINAYPLESSSWNSQSTALLWNYQCTPVLLKLFMKRCLPPVSTLTKDRSSSWNWWPKHALVPEAVSQSTPILPLKWLVKDPPSPQSYSSIDHNTSSPREPAKSRHPCWDCLS